MRVLHLSDTHLPRTAGPGPEGLDARAVLADLLHDVRHLRDIDLVVVSGDVADDGSPEAYRDALGLVGTFARRYGAATAYCVGNHDAREAFTAVLGSGHRDADGLDVGLRAPGCTAAVSLVAGVRVVTLDSLVPGQVHGRLGPGQLAWLRDVLATPYGAGSDVVLHHPPIALHGTVQPEVGLRDPTDLAEALAGSDVRVVLCGHFHLQLAGALGAVPVWVGPGVVTRIDLTAPAGLERAVLGAAATVVDLGPQGSPLVHTVHARDPRSGELVHLVDAVSGRAREEADG